MSTVRMAVYHRDSRPMLLITHATDDDNNSVPKLICRLGVLMVLPLLLAHHLTTASTRKQCCSIGFILHCLNLCC